MARRKLQKLKISEISLVDRGAGVGTRICLLKRDSDTRIMEDHMDPITIQKRVDDRITEIRKADGSLSRQQAVARLAMSKIEADRDLWQFYKMTAPVAPTVPETPPTPVVSDAYIELRRKAEKALRKDPALGTLERAFSKIYSAPENAELVAEEKAAHFAKAAAPALMPQVDDAEDIRPAERTSGSPNMQSLREIARSIQLQFPDRYDDDEALLIAARTPKGQNLLRTHRDRDFARLLGHAA